MVLCNYAAPVVQPAVMALGQSVPAIHDKDDTMCLLPQCHRQRYRELDGTVHPYCGRSHAELAESMNIAGTVGMMNMAVASY